MNRIINEFPKVLRKTNAFQMIKYETIDFKPISIMYEVKKVNFLDYNISKNVSYDTQYETRDFDRKNI